MTLARLDSLPFVHGYGGLGPAFAVEVQPSPLPGAELLHANAPGCALLGLEPADLQDPRATACFTGAEPLPGARPVATVYSGHQFGVWAGQLGDGRAILLGEVADESGELWDVQLKGAGRTPFSRFGDGRAVLRSTLREYVAGEAMAGLGIATTRSLAIFRSELDVERESIEKGALLVRLARCHVRIGTFEHFQAAQREDSLRILLGYCLGRWFSGLADADSDSGTRALAFLHEVARRTARLVAQWMSVGFCHGVLNTDNMSILGETIDYGPFAFLDDYAAEHVCNHSDVHGRYAFGRQPAVGHWNLLCLAQALWPLLDAGPMEEVGERLSAVYGEAFEDEYRSCMARKLGIAREAPGLGTCIESSLALLGRGALDHTRFWRELSRAELCTEPPALTGCAGLAGLDEWWRGYLNQRRTHPAGGGVERASELMLAANPKFIARNYLLAKLIAEPDARQQAQRLAAWLDVLARPFDEHPEHEAWARPPLGAQKAITNSCSS